MSDADGGELHTRAALDILDDNLQVGLQVLVAVGRERGFVNRCAVGDDDQDATRLGASQQAAMRPDERFAVDSASVPLM